MTIPIRRALHPGAIVVGAALAHRFVPAALTDERLRLALLAALVSAGILAVRMGRGRALYALIWVAGSVALLHPAAVGPLADALASPSDAAKTTAGALLGLLLPLNVAVLSLAREWRPLSVDGLLRLLAAVAQLLGIAWLMRPDAAADAIARLQPLTQRAGVEFASWPVDGLVGAGWGAFVAAACVATIRLAQRPDDGHMQAGLIGLLIALGLALAGIAGPPLLWALAAALVLIATLVENAFTLAFEDGLTGLPGRRALDERLPQLGRAYALAMLDLDHFKKFNDKHGHEVGDDVLRMVARQLQRVGGGGTAYRYGGEEFAVVFPGRAAADAEAPLEILREAVASTPFRVRGSQGGKPLQVTISIGVAERGGALRTPEQVLKEADRALYRSKKAGRNCVTVASAQHARASAKMARAGPGARASTRRSTAKRPTKRPRSGGGRGRRTV
ncbi:MAG: GGDEF domain-containing protein [Acidobacteriota bacterium]